MKDVDEAPYAGNKVQCQQIFQTQCQHYNRSKLLVNDFIEFIKSIEKIRTAKVQMEKAIDKRHFQIYNCGGNYDKMVQLYDSHDSGVIEPEPVSHGTGLSGMG